MYRMDRIWGGGVFTTEGTEPVMPKAWSTARGRRDTIRGKGGASCTPRCRGFSGESQKFGAGESSSGLFINMDENTVT